MFSLFNNSIKKIPFIETVEEYINCIACWCKKYNYERQNLHDWLWAIIQIKAETDLHLLQIAPVVIAVFLCTYTLKYTQTTLALNRRHTHTHTHTHMRFV